MFLHCTASSDALKLREIDKRTHFAVIANRLSNFLRDSISFAPLCNIAHAFAEHCRAEKTAQRSVS